MQLQNIIQKYKAEECYYNHFKIFMTMKNLNMLIRMMKHFQLKYIWENVKMKVDVDQRFI